MKTEFRQKFAWLKNYNEYSDRKNSINKNQLIFIVNRNENEEVKETKKEEKLGNNAVILKQALLLYTSSANYSQNARQLCIIISEIAQSCSWFVDRSPEDKFPRAVRESLRQKR